MVILIKAGTPGWRQRYNGWYIHTAKEAADLWESGVVTPDRGQMIRYEPSHGDDPYHLDLWAYKKTETNEFGLVTP